MITAEKHGKMAQFDKDIKTAISALLPDWEKQPNICIAVSWPREYMGRFDAGKVHWTIDLSETATYSRIKQVRVKDVGGLPVFNADKVRTYFAELRAIVKAENERRERLANAKKALPKLPPEMQVTPRNDGKTYEVKIWFKPMTLEQVVKAAELVAAMRKAL